MSKFGGESTADEVLEGLEVGEEVVRGLCLELGLIVQERRHS